ncbi:MAG: hypothetical protein ACR2FH_04240 [Caulobacteraceae bacterium]
MTTKSLSTVVMGEYVLAAQYDGLDITTTGGVSANDAAGLLLDHAATVSNLGAISNLEFLSSYGVEATAAASIANGSPAVTSALIRGYDGVRAHDAATVITNYGTILGVARNGIGVRLDAAGVVENGHHFAGTIYGGNTGIFAQGAATSDNFGLVRGFYGEGVLLSAGGGTVRNGAIRDIKATITGAGEGMYVAAGAADVVNYGTIQSSQRAGVRLGGGGALSNGGIKGKTADTVALIAGQTNGAAAYGYATIANLGTIEGATGDGVLLFGGGSLINGSARDTAATIAGFQGVEADYYGVKTTVTNFGTISGTGGAAILFKDANDTLIVEAGCAFVGKVLGGGGTLDLDSGKGKLTGNLASGTITVPGAVAVTAFTGFDTVEIGAAASFATTGAVGIAAGQSLVVAGSLTLNANKVANGGTVETLGGTVTVKGRVTGDGAAVVDGGRLEFMANFIQAVTFAGGTGTLELAKSQSYTGIITGFSKTGGTFLDLDDIAFGGSTTATYAGDKKSGTLTVTDGTHTAHIALKGDYRTSTFVAASDGHGGTLVHDPAKAAAVPSPHPFVAAMAAMSDATGFGRQTTTAEPWRSSRWGLSRPASRLA